MARWARLVMLRDGVNAALETARANKLIGKPLEASVTLFCDEAAYAAFQPLEKLLAELCIVSHLHVVPGTGEGVPCEGMEGVSIRVERTHGEKCDRCWIYSDTVGQDAEHPTLCKRCADVVRAMQK